LLLVFIRVAFSRSCRTFSCLAQRLLRPCVDQGRDRLLGTRDLTTQLQALQAIKDLNGIDIAECARCVTSPRLCVSLSLRSSCTCSVVCTVSLREPCSPAHVCSGRLFVPCFCSPRMSCLSLADIPHCCCSCSCCGVLQEGRVPVAVIAAECGHDGLRTPWHTADREPARAYDR
jgi:hypothetical protein